RAHVLVFLRTLRSVMRTVLVTGGGSGIGRDIAAAFAADGHAVTILGRRSDVLEPTATQIGATPVTCDVSDPAAIADALPHLPDAVDVVVNNAGANTDFDGPDPEPGDLAGLAAAWEANLRSNLLSAVMFTAGVRSRLAATDARIVTVGSIAARTGAGSYGAAKAAVEAWTASTAASLGGQGTANVVSPGYIHGTDYFRGRLSDARYERLVESTFVKRPGTPQDVAETVSWLASPAARHVTAQVIHVNGGAYLGR